MPLIKPRPHRVTIVRHLSRLQEPNRNALVAYARFIGETPDYVLNQLIESTLAKDREFVAWQAEQPSSRPLTSDPHPRRSTPPAAGTED